MLDLLVVSVVLPLLIAAGVFLWTFVSSALDVRRSRGKVAAAVFTLSVFAWVSILVVKGGLEDRVALASLYPSLLSESTVELRWDTALWPYGLILLLSIGALMLTRVGRGDLRPGQVAGLLVLLSAGLAAIWSANPLTTIVCWALYDFSGAGAQIMVGEKAEIVVRRLILGTASGLMLWLGVSRAGGGMGSVPWGLMPADDARTMLWLLAGLVRIEAYPFHVSVSREMAASSPLAGALLLSPVLGWVLWARLISTTSGRVPVPTLVLLVGALTALAGALLAWTAASPQKGHPWISMSVTGRLLMAASLLSSRGGGTGAASSGAIVIFGVVGWMCGTALLFVGGGLNLQRVLHGKDLYRALPWLAGALSLVGVPGTIGFLPIQSLITGGGEAVPWTWGLVILLSQVFLVAALIRWSTGSYAVEPGTGNVLGNTVARAGLVVLVLVLVAFGLIPNRLLPGFASTLTPALNPLLVSTALIGCGLWLGGTLVGTGLAWVETSFRYEASVWKKAAHDVLLMDWAYDLVAGTVDQGLGLVRAVDDIVGGRGALLWATLILLILVLMGGV